MHTKNIDIEHIARAAQQYRGDIIDMIYHAKAGHPGGSLSAIDIIAYLYEMDIDPTQQERSRFVLSKGHAVPALYAVLYRKGFLKEEEMRSFRCINSRLQGHTDVCALPETDVSSGLLGQGLSIGVGMALGKRLKKSDKRVYVMCGDGELHEGQIWEALMEGAHYALDNLHLIIDRNNLSSKAPLGEVMEIEPLADKLRAFNWHVQEVDGHDLEAISACFEGLHAVRGKPKCVLANTIKGKGVSFMENVAKWHSSALTDEEYAIAKRDIWGWD